MTYVESKVMRRGKLLRQPTEDVTVTTVITQPINQNQKARLLLSSCLSESGWAGITVLALSNSSNPERLLVRFSSAPEADDS